MTACSECGIGDPNLTTCQSCQTDLHAACAFTCDRCSARVCSRCAVTEVPDEVLTCEMCTEPWERSA